MVVGLRAILFLFRSALILVVVRVRVLRVVRVVRVGVRLRVGVEVETGVWLVVRLVVRLKMRVESVIFRREVLIFILIKVPIRVLIILILILKRVQISILIFIRLLIIVLLVSDVTSSVGVNPGIFENVLQFVVTEDIPSQLTASRFVVVQMSHHFSSPEIHIHSNMPVLRRSCIGII